MILNQFTYYISLPGSSIDKNIFGKHHENSCYGNVMGFMIDIKLYM